MKQCKLINSTRWAAVGLALVLGLPALAQSGGRFKGTFSGEVTSVDDPENRFQGVVQVGTAVSGEYTYTLPDGSGLILSARFGTATLDSYDYSNVYASNNDVDGSDSFHLLTYTLHPPEFQPPAPGIYNDGELHIDLIDPTGTALSSADLIDFPLGDNWLGGFSIAGGEFFLWELDGGNWSIVATAQFRITSYATEIAPTMVVPSYSFVDETAGSITVTVNRAGDASGAASVDYATANDSALAGADYIATNGSLTFAPGVTSQSFTVTILDDKLREGYEWFRVEFSNALGAEPSTFTANIAIVDDEPAPPDVFASSPKVLESEAGSIVITVSRSGDLSEATTLDYVTVDGSAVAGEDYVAVSGSLTFAPNEDTKSFPVTILADNVKESPEKFSILFTNVVGAIPNAFYSSVTIYDPAPLSVDLTFDPGAGADGEVYDLIPLANGKIYALGTFTNIGGFQRPFVARLNSNGSVDASFNAGKLNSSDKGKGKGPQKLSPNGQKIEGLDNAVSSLIPLPNGRVLVAGRFTEIGGSEQAFVARLLEDGRLDNSFRPEINGPVFRMALQPDGKLVIAGDFAEVNGVARHSIARLNARGQLDAGFDAGAGPDWPPATVALEPDGKILVGGAFSTFSGASRRAAARLLPNGQLDWTYDLKIDDYAPFFFPIVTKFIVRPDGSHFLIGLSVHQVAGVYVNGVPALVNNDGTLNSSYGGYANWLFANRPPTAAEPLADGGMILSGMFQYVPFPELPNPPVLPDDSTSLWRLKADGSPDFSIDPVNFPVTDYFDGTKIVVKGMILDVAVQPDGKLLLAGDFTQVSGVPRKGMARIIAP